MQALPAAAIVDTDDRPLVDKDHDMASYIPPNFGDMEERRLHDSVHAARDTAWAVGIHPHIPEANGGTVLDWGDLVKTGSHHVQ